MARFLSDQSKVVLLLESGIYSAPLTAGIWPGMVQSHDFIEKQGTIETRFLGQGNRNVGFFSLGPLDVTGKMEFLPQDWRLLGYALGSITTTSGTLQSSNYRFDIAEVNSSTRANAFTSGIFNPFISFSVEESRTGPTANQNSMRTIKGCVVEDYTLQIAQHEPVKIDVNLLGQIGSWFSGATTTVTAGSNRPYLWSDTVFQISPDQAGGAVVTQESVKDFKFNIKNSFTGPHYINGSRVIQVPYPINRDYSVDVTQDLDSATVGSLYDALFKGGSFFNAVLDINNTFDAGSHHLVVTYSGCRMITMEIPAKISAVTEVKYSFIPGSVSAVSFDRLPLYTAF